MVQFVNEADPNREQRSTFPDESVFEAQLEEITVRKTPRKDGRGENTWLDWWFRITASDIGEEFVGRRVKGSAFGDLEAQEGYFGRFNRWSAALLNKDEIERGYHLDTDDLIGMKASIMVVVTPDKRDPSKKWPEVTEVVGMGPTTGGYGTDDPPF